MSRQGSALSKTRRVWTAAASVSVCRRLAQPVCPCYPQEGESPMVNHPNDPGPSENFSLIEPLIAVVVFVVDLFLPMAVGWSQSPLLAGVLAGAVCGQFSLLCLWAVFGTERLLARWPGSLLVAVLLYGVLLAGISVVPAPGDPDLRPVIMGALMLPFLFLLSQVPLWVVRLATCWRIVVDGTQDACSPRQSRQFGLQHIFGATAAVAVALGLASLGLPLLDWPDATPDPSVWLGLMAAFLACGVWAMLWILPCLWAAFIARDKVAGTAIIAVYAAVMSFLILAVMDILSGGGPNQDGLTLLAICLFHGGLAVVLLGSLHLLRSGGYVLLRPGRRQPPATPGGSSPPADTGDPSLPSSL